MYVENILDLRTENPIEDKDMFFDEEYQQYVLKKDYPLNRLFLDEGIEQWARTSKQFDKMLLEISDDIYRYIENHTQRASMRTKMFIIKKDELARVALKRAMLAQVRYYLRSGAGAVKDMVGVDIERSRAIKINELRGDRQLSPDAITILNSHPILTYTGQIFKVNIKEV